MDYDIIIVGAGPAGANFARLAAESDKNKKILLVDGQTEEHAKPCGGLLAPDAQRSLAYFDLTLPKSVLVDPQIFSVKTIDAGSGIVRYYPRHYLNMDRYAFDRWFVSLVPDCVEILRGRCIDVRREKVGFSVTISTEAGEKTVSSKRVVGADGAGSCVRKALCKTDVMHYVAIQQWFKAVDENPFYSCIFDPETSESCSWSIHKNNYFIFGGCFLPEKCRENFELQKTRLTEKFGFSFGEPVKTEACTVLRPRHLRDFQTGKNGAYLIGEAAGFISPSSFEGISSAIMSASLLAKALRQGGDDDRALSRIYRRGTASLRLKLMAKVLKRWFMYTPFARRVIMRSGLKSIRPLVRDK